MNSEQPLKKRHILLFPLLTITFTFAICVSSFAQETDTIVPVDKNPEEILRDVDISDITRNGLTLWKNKFSGHFAGIDFGFNMLLNKDYSGYQTEFMENDVFRSNSAYFNVLQQSFRLQKNKNNFGLVTGLGLRLQSYRLKDGTTLIKDENNVIYPEYLYFNDQQKSKLALVSLTVPLLAEWQIPINHFDNRVYVSAGILGSLRLNGHSKIKYRTEEKQKHKIVDDFSIHTFKYSLMVRTGYRWFNVFALYDLVPLFKEDKGPELTPFTFGITLLRF